MSIAETDFTSPVEFLVNSAGLELFFSDNKTAEKSVRIKPFERSRYLTGGAASGNFRS